MEIRKFQFGLHFGITPIKYKNLSLLPLFWFFEFNRHENHPHLHLHFYPSTTGMCLLTKSYLNPIVYNFGLKLWLLEFKVGDIYNILIITLYLLLENNIPVRQVLKGTFQILF